VSAISLSAPDATAPIEVVNPYTGERVGSVRAATAGEADAATRAASEYTAELSAAERAELLERTAEAVLGRSEELTASIVAEAGTAAKDAAREVRRAATILRACAEEAKRLIGQAIPTDVTPGAPRRLAVTSYEPIGVVLAITPFNRPLNQVAVKLAPAIAAGCSVVLKPSERAPLTALELVRTLVECGVPEPMVTVVTGRPEEIGDALVTSPHVDLIAFTGSVAVGRRIAEQSGFARLMLELGDSSALLVLADADVGAAARAAAAGAFASAGQSCRGVKRVIADERVADELTEALVEEARALRVGDPADPQTDVGTLIDEPAAIEVERRVSLAVSAGARLLHGGRRERAQMWPTVLDRVPPDAPLVADETFGPCAPVIRVRGVEEAIEVANGTPFGLQAGVFTRDVDAALRCGRMLRVGTVVVNDGPQFDSPSIPFGGVKASGMGREGANYSIREMSVVKTIVL
jgi:acyl-CoA reductase-like NAD-dependent aldehyde dehydrogenase